MLWPVRDHRIAKSELFQFRDEAGSPWRALRTMPLVSIYFTRHASSHGAHTCNPDYPRTLREWGRRFGGEFDTRYHREGLSGSEWYSWVRGVQAKVGISTSSRMLVPVSQRATSPVICSPLFVKWVGSFYSLLFLLTDSTSWQNDTPVRCDWFYYCKSQFGWTYYL